MIELFKEGTSRNYNGITCDSMIVNEFGFEPLLKQGWVLDPKELYKDEGETQKVEKPIEKEVTKTATSKVTTAGPKVPNTSLRVSASSKATPKSGNIVTKK